MSVITHTYSSWQLTWCRVKRPAGRVSSIAQKLYFLSILKTLSHISFKTLQLFLNKGVECSLENNLHSFIDILAIWKWDPASLWKTVYNQQQWRTQEFFFFLGGGSTNSVEDRGQRERGSGCGSPLVRGSGGSCKLVQEISLHMVTFSSFFVL